MSIKCAHCKGKHETVAQVRFCAEIDNHDPYAGMPPVATAEEFARLDPTKAHVVEQKDLGWTEQDERRWDAEIQRRERLEDERAAQEMKMWSRADRERTWTGSSCSGRPAEMLNQTPGERYRHSLPAQVWPKNAVPLEDGIYRNPATKAIFKVYHTVHGANQQVAKRLVMLEQPYTKISRGKEVEVKAEFVYEGKRGLEGLTPEMRMTLEQAKEYGAVYGVCVRCAATLTREESIERAMGSTCASKI